MIFRHLSATGDDGASVARHRRELPLCSRNGADGGLYHHDGAGTGEKGFAGDGGPATAALLNGPFDVAFDRAGNLYFSDTFNHRIRRVDARERRHHHRRRQRRARLFRRRRAGDSRPRSTSPTASSLDRAGNIYVADRLNRRVRRIDAATGIITTLAGTGEAGLWRRWRAGGATPGWPSRTASRSMPDGARALHRRCRRPPRARRRSRRGHDRDLRRHRRSRAQRRRRPGARRPASSAPAPSRSAPTAPSTSSSARAAACAPSIRTTGIITTVAGTGARGYSRRWRPGARRGVRRAEGDGDRPRRQPPDRRHREPRDPPDRPSHRHRQPRSPAAARARAAMAARPTQPGSTGRTARWSAPMARSISATPTTTASANSSVAHKPEKHGIPRGGIGSAYVRC